MSEAVSQRSGTTGLPFSLESSSNKSATSSIDFSSASNALHDEKDILEQYRQLKTRCEEMEVEQALSGASSEHSDATGAQKKSLLEQLKRLEQLPRIKALDHSKAKSDSRFTGTNGVRKREERSEDTDSRQPKRQRLSSEEDAYNEGGAAVRASPAQESSNDTTASQTEVEPSSGSARLPSSTPTIPSTANSSGASSDGDAPATVSATSSVPTPSASSSSMSSNPYAAYLTGNNPYAFYYLQAPPLIHPGLSMPGMPRMYMPPPGPSPAPQTQSSANHFTKPQSQQSEQQPRQAQGKPKRLKSHAVTTKNFNIPLVPRDSQGKPMLPLNVGIMTVLSLGEVCMREHFHTERYIFPVGYEVTRRYLSTKDKNIEVVYHCSILDGGDGPKFQIIPSDAPELTVIAGTATGAWSNIVRKANALRNRQHSNSVSGPDFFGLGQNTIKHLIQQLPNADKLRDYVWQNFVEGGPLGGRHAAVVPALPEDYDTAMTMGAFHAIDKDRYQRHPNQPSDQAGGIKHYPSHLGLPPGAAIWNSSTASSSPTPAPEPVPIDPQLSGPEPASTTPVSNKGGDTSSVITDGPPGVAEAIATIINALPTTNSETASS
ncbi:hypothetical protein AAF712_003830 [Marasmius tenuissimus]|uniref:Transforming growth factor beta regulator 1 n=1 Tax=Marasmius tenuissimus TaxID=585030 RepID=A0ABR3A868_9AGAR